MRPIALFMPKTCPLRCVSTTARRQARETPASPGPYLGIVQRRLVEVLERLREQEQRQDAKVDPAENCTILGRSLYGVEGGKRESDICGFDLGSEGRTIWACC